MDFIHFSFAHATIITRNISIGALAVVTTYVQMFSYGYGFLESWIKLNVLEKSPEMLSRSIFTNIYTISKYTI